MRPVNVFITIDTEHSIGGSFGDPQLKPVGNDKRIYGRIGGKEYGIPLIMDIADRYGIPLTFFVEVFNKYYFGEGETREVCEYILGRGHDVQLHLHPNFLNFKEDNPADRKYSDNMSAYDLQSQVDMLAEGKELLTRYCGKVPVAFRAGNYGADRNTLNALKENGFQIDSSYNAAFPKHSHCITEKALNDAEQIDGVWELPITNFVEKIPLCKKRFKPLDFNGVNCVEMKSVIVNSCQDKGPQTVTLILHSFSFLNTKDVQYRKCTVRKNVINRFESLCCFLSEQTHCLHCGIFTDFASKGFGDANNHTFLPMPPKYSLVRAVEQLFG